MSKFISWTCGNVGRDGAVCRNQDIEMHENMAIVSNQILELDHYGLPVYGAIGVVAIDDMHPSFKRKFCCSKCRSVIFEGNELAFMKYLERNGWLADDVEQPDQQEQHELRNNPKE